MNGEILIRPIARIRNDYSEKFGIPRQSRIVNEVESLIIFEPEYRVDDALRGIDGFSHIWLIWGFSEAKREGWSPTVRPPRLGGNRRMGVFATRSPFRPNGLGLSSVELRGLVDTGNEGTALLVTGADLMDGTPIYDIKPYIPYADSIPNALGGFTSDLDGLTLDVSFPAELLSLVPEEKRTALLAVLSHDPRPTYQEDPERVYGMAYGDMNVKFRVADGTLTVCAVEDVRK